MNWTIALFIGIIVTIIVMGIIFKVKMDRYKAHFEEKNQLNSQNNNVSNPLNEIYEENKKSLELVKQELTASKEKIDSLTAENIKLASENGHLHGNYEESQKNIELAKKEVATTKEKVEQLSAENRQLSTDNGRLRGNYEENQKSLDQLKKDLTSTKEKVEHLTLENKKLASDNEGLQREKQLKEEQATTEKEERAQQYEAQLKLMKEQITTATQQMLNTRSEELSKVNQTQMDAIIKPLKDTITAMEKSMTENKDTNNKNTASLEKAIEEIMKRATMIGDNANHLAEALRNENKIQGNWGEVILDELLQNQGLKEGIHYDRQATITDENGKAIKSENGEKIMIPDVILHYPDNKDAIIDSKVSLAAFLEYQEAKNDDERAIALKKHLDSVKHQAKLLSTKNYSKYIKPSRQAIDYVIMFIPNESAYQLAMANDPTIWRNAFENGVFITGEMTLIAALRMISVAWTQVEQAHNQEAILAQAQTIVDRTSDFMSKFSELEVQLNRASDKFTDAKKKLYQGNQSLLRAASRMVELGVKENSKKRLPKEDSLMLEENTNPED